MEIANYVAGIVREDLAKQKLNERVAETKMDGGVALII